MSGDLFNIKFIRAKTSFLYIPERWARKLRDLNRLEDDSVIKVSVDSNKSAYFSWQQISLKEDNVVKLNATVASNLGFKEGDTVSLAVCNSPPSIHRVEMSPVSSDDLEMIEQSSVLLQSTLLNQVRVVWQDQYLTAWITNSLPIVLHVGKMEPDISVGRLEQLTEVVILDPIGSRMNALENSDLGSSNLINDIVSSGKSLASSVLNAVKGGSANEEEKMENNFASKKAHFIVRVHPLKNGFQLHSPLDAFLPSASFAKLFPTCVNGHRRLFCKIARLQSPRDADSSRNIKLNQESTSTKAPNVAQSMQRNNDLSTYIRLLSVHALPESEEYYSYHEDCIYLSNNLRNTLHLEIGSRVILSDFKAKAPAARLEEVELYPHHGIEYSDLAISLIQHIEQMPDGLLLSNNMLLTIPTRRGLIDAKVRLLPFSLTHFLALPGQLDERKIRVRLEKRTREDQKVSVKPFIPRDIADNLHLKHLQSIINEGLLSLKLTLGLHKFSLNHEEAVHFNNNVLLLGKRGCGKTSTASALCSLLQGPPHFVHNAIIKCRPLKGKTVESILKQFQSFVNDCVCHQPSILVLDDLDCIAGVPEDQDQDSQRSSYFNRVGRMLLQLLSCLQSKHFVGIVATATSTSSISPSIVPPRGIHFLSTRLELPELSKADRKGVLEALLNRKLRDKQLRDVKCFEDVEEYAKKTEGYSCEDLADLVDKGTHAACMRQVLSSKLPMLESCDMYEALSESTPMVLRGVSLHKDFSFGWDDIGGLTEVKKQLKEVFEWPVLYPELFQNSPLRQQSGLLLYGAPGTGKTMLAGAVARECGLNFISVKGPELLSKYIGASEEAVRNVFSKAQSAKPCVLFFDEFDSLAPRRGHDNTGVTDRVVNQLLTQLDGVENLVGVWVLAATSRPDLLDPALLRPGRLDRSVLCSLPDETSRLAILNTLSRKMNLDSSVDFTQIAVQTEGFTGADLQSILYSAQLKAVEEHQLKSAEGNIPLGGSQVDFRVSQAHLEFSFANTRPSLTLKERTKYLYIYSKFGASRKEDVSGLEKNMQRATLA